MVNIPENPIWHFLPSRPREIPGNRPLQCYWDQKSHNLESITEKVTVLCNVLSHGMSKPITRLWGSAFHSATRKQIKRLFEVEESKVGKPAISGNWMGSETGRRRD